MSGLCQAPAYGIAHEEAVAHVLGVREVAITVAMIAMRLGWIAGAAAAEGGGLQEIASCQHRQVLQNVDSLVGW